MRPNPTRFGVITLIVGILAVPLIVWPWVGLGVGLAGIVLHLLTRSRSRGSHLAVVGFALSIFGAAGNVVVILVVSLVFPAIGSWIAHGGYDDNAGENSRYNEQYDLSRDYLIDTPCYSFTGPEGWINHQNDYFDADCRTSLEDHGPLDDSGRYVFDSRAGTDLYGSVLVSAQFASTGSIGDDVQLDGVDASLSRTEGTDEVMPTITIDVEMPEAKSNYYGQFDRLQIVIEAAPDEIDELLDQVVDSWQWK